MIYLTTYISENMEQINKRQREHILGRTLLKVGLRREYALFLSELWLDTKVYGKPYLPEYPNIHFNISHCDGMVVCGIHDRKIGVDVERIRPCSGSLLAKVLSEEEQTAFDKRLTDGRMELRRSYTPELFFRYWTLKESYLKATGAGLSVPMKNISFSWKQDNGTEKIICSQPGFEFHQICLDGAYVLAVCVEKIRWEY